MTLQDKIAAALAAERVKAVEEERAFKPTHRHYKGGLYQVIGFASHSETHEALMVYKNASGSIWVRPLAMFNELVWWEGAQVPRFDALITEEPTS